MLDKHQQKKLVETIILHTQANRNEPSKHKSTHESPIALILVVPLQNPAIDFVPDHLSFKIWTVEGQKLSWRLLIPFIKDKSGGRVSFNPAIVLQ